MSTNEQIKHMVAHVIYEFKEFRKSIDTLPQLNQSDPNWNPTLESFLLHFRILRAFFFAEGNHGDDLFARHYVGSERWNPNKQEVFCKTKDEIDKRLAHLTLRRLTPWDWEEDKMAQAIEGLIAEFKNSLRGPQANWFSELQVRTVPPAAVTGNRATGEFCCRLEMNRFSEN